MPEHTGDLQDKWIRRWTFTRESQIGLAAQYIAQLKKEKEELRLECNRLYGIGQEYDEEIVALKWDIAFFVSVIKAGEPWTETCQARYAALLTVEESE